MKILVVYLIDLFCGERAHESYVLNGVQKKAAWGEAARVLTEAGSSVSNHCA